MIIPDLRDADLSGVELTQADLYAVELFKANLDAANLREAILLKASLWGATLRDADLSRAELTRLNLSTADLSGAILIEAEMFEANLSTTDLIKADLSGAYLNEANLTEADFSDATLNGADLSGTIMVMTNFKGAKLNDCRVYGVSAWDLNLSGSEQMSLVITPEEEPVITVDNLEVAQFIYLLLRSDRIRHIIDTITSKVVLILGRFTKERKTVLNAIREELRKYDYIPVLFDFDKPTTKDTHETITTLARMSRFIIADITDAKSIPQELVSIVEQLPSLPVQPILQQDCEPWGMYDHIRRYPWVLELYRYDALDEFIPRIREAVISPAEMKVMEIRKKS